MQHGVGRSAHGDVERHRVLERLEARDRARQRGIVVLLVIAPRQIDDQMAGLDEQALAIGMRRQHRAVARQRQPQRLGEAVHRIGREHARARAAGRARRALDHFDVGIADIAVGGGDHGVDQVDRALLALEVDLARFHRAARDEHGRDVEPQRRHQHAGRDLVAVGDADHGVGAMRVDHVFDAVGDDLARWQAVQHAVMAHGDAVIHRDGVELLGDTAGFLDLACDELAEILQVHVAGHELGERIDHGNDRLAKILVLHAGGAPEAAGARHVAAVSRGSGAIGGHGISSG